MMKLLVVCLSAFLSSCSSPEKKEPLIKPEAKYTQRTEKMTLLYSGHDTQAKNIKVFNYKTDQKSVYGKTTIHVLFPETQKASTTVKERIKKIKTHLKKDGYRKNQFHETDLLTVKGNSIPVIVKIYQAVPPICDSTLYQKNHAHCAYIHNKIQMTEDVSVFFSDKPMAPVHSAPLIKAITEAGHTEESTSGNDLEDEDTEGDGHDDKTGAPGLKDIIGGSSNPVGGGLLSAILPGGKK